MGGDYRLTIRVGPKIERRWFPALDPAVAAMEERFDALGMEARRGAVDLHLRRFEPVQQVVARAEVSGPGRWRRRGGVDVRGDGSAEAWLGGFRRRLVEARPGETPYNALKRVLAGAADAGSGVS